MKRRICTLGSILVLGALGGWGIASTSAGAATGDALLAYGLNESAGATATDASGNGRNGAVSSATWTPSGRFGAALSFDGAQSRLTTTSPLAISANFSLTAWLFNPSASGYETILAAGTERDIFLVDGRLSLFDGSRDIDLGALVPSARWVHVAVTADGSNIRAFVDGTPSTPVAAATSAAPDAPLQVGAWPSGGSNHDHFSGRLDEVRWYSRALSPSEVSADMATAVSAGGNPPPATTTTTTPQATTTVPAATTTTTTTTTPATTTTVPATTTTTAPPAGGRSLRFFANGRNGIDRVRIPLTPNRTIDVGGDFTIEWWMKVAGPLTGGSCSTGESAWIYGNILVDRDVYGGGDNGDYGISLFGGGGGTLAFGVTRGSSGVTLCSTVGVADGAWHHVAVTRRSSSGALAIYIDGQPRGSSTGPTGDVSYRDGRSTFAGDDPYLVFGAEKHDAGSEYPSYPGWLDELRVSSSVRYTGTYTAPRARLAADAATVALYHADEGSGTVLADATGANPGTLLVGGSPVGPVWTTDVPF